MRPSDRDDTPDSLRHLKNFLLYNLSQNEDGTPSKVPHYVNLSRRVGEQGAPADLHRLSTYAVAREAADAFGCGIGFAFLPGSGQFGVDFDDCVIDGVIKPEVLAAIKGVYAEYSVSGRGIHAFGLGQCGAWLNEKNPHALGGGVEVFTTQGYFAMTGRAVDPTVPLGPATSALRLHVAQQMAQPSTKGISATSPSPRQPLLGSASTDGQEGVTPMTLSKRVGVSTSDAKLDLSHLDPDMSYPDWVRVGMALHNEFAGEPGGLELWEEWSAAGTKHAEGLTATKWEGFGQKDTRESVTYASIKKMALSITHTVIDPVKKAVAVQRFALVQIAAFAGGDTDTDWIIRGVLPRAPLVLLYGASGTGKSFVALDMAMAIVRGERWRGERTAQMRVAYVAAEGVDGFKKRARAYARANDIDLSLLDFHIIPDCPNFTQAIDISAVIAAIQAVGDVGLIIVDTLAQVMGGADENSSEDMGLTIGHCRELNAQTQAGVMLIHHAGKDKTRGARGWSGLRAAADAEIEIDRDKAGARTIRVTKMKDGRDDGAWGFELETVELFTNPFGEIVDSCVVVATELPIEVEVVKPPTLGQQWVLTAIAALKVARTSSMVEGVAEAITVTDIAEEVVAQALKTDPNLTSQQRRGKRRDAKTNLEKLSIRFGSDFELVGEVLVFVPRGAV